MKVAVIIRFHYNQDDARFNWRFNHFKANVLPRILNQTYKDFDVCVGVNEWQVPLFKELGLKPFTADWKTKYKQHPTKNLRYFHDFIKHEDLNGLDKYNLQIGLDSDDYIEKDYVELIVNETLKHIKQNPNKTLHICYQPEYLILKTGQIKPMKVYSIKRGSAFMGLYQPEVKRFIYEASHMIMPRKADIFKILPKGHCYACVHDLNESTGK